MAKVKIDLVRQERYEKMLLALQSLRDKGLWNSYVTIYSAHPRADHSVEVRLDKHNNLVLHLSEEYFEPITMHDHFITKMEKKELKKIENAYKKEKEFLEKHDWKYEENNKFVTVNVKSFMRKKVKKFIRSFDFTVDFGKKPEDLIFPIDRIFINMFGLPSNYTIDVVKSLK